MSRILFLVNEDIVIYNFRLEVVQKFLDMGEDVYISCPYGHKLEKLKEMGAKIEDIYIDRRGTNLFKDSKLIRAYKKMIKRIRPDFVLSYTVKPNIYGAIACKKYNVPIVATITGLGNGIHDGGIVEKVLLFLYKRTFKTVNKVFFQNSEDCSYFIEHKLLNSDYEIIPGSGVNLAKYCCLPYPKDISFLFASRVMKQKGIEEFLDAASFIKKKQPTIMFEICGPCDSEYEEIIKKYNMSGVINYYGRVTDPIDYYKKSACIVLPSYHEGMSNTLLEAASCGRPLIASDVCGCKEIIDDGINGFLCKAKNTMSLIKAIEQFILLPFDERKKMGAMSRKKVENNFDRKDVIDKYVDAFKKYSKKERE